PNLKFVGIAAKANSQQASLFVVSQGGDGFHLSWHPQVKAGEGLQRTIFFLHQLCYLGYRHVVGCIWATVENILAPAILTAVLPEWQVTSTIAVARRDCHPAVSCAVASSPSGTGRAGRKSLQLCPRSVARATVRQEAALGYP